MHSWQWLLIGIAAGLAVPLTLAVVVWVREYSIRLGRYDI